MDCPDILPTILEAAEYLHMLQGKSLGVVTTALAAYVLPWYPAVFLPLAGLVPRRRVAVALHVVAAALLVAYVQPPGRPTSALVGAGAVASVCGVGLALAAASVLARPSPASPATPHRAAPACHTPCG